MSKSRHYRIGQIVPSSNVTMEHEVPAMLSRAEVPAGVSFSFHSARAPMKTVSVDELTAMNAHMTRCAGELADARMDVVASACLVAIMCQGAGYHRETETQLRAVSGEARVITSAGALIEALQAIGARRIALIAPYMKPLTECVIAYIESEGIAVASSCSLEVADNLAVAALDPMRLPAIANELDTRGVDAVVLSACVQMPSLPALDITQRAFDVPVLSSAAATAYKVLRELGLPTRVPRAGKLLSGVY